MANLKEQATYLSKMFRETADELDKRFDNARIDRATGNGVTKAGVLTAITGIVLAPVTLGASLIVTTVGTAVGCIGRFIAVRAEVTGMGLEKVKYSQVNKLWDAFREEMKVMLDSGMTVHGIAAKLRNVGVSDGAAMHFATNFASVSKTVPIGAGKTVITQAIKIEAKALTAVSLGLSVTDLIMISVDMAKEVKLPVGCLLLRRLADDLDHYFKD